MVDTPTTGRGPRTYRSGRRAQAAADTHAAILSAALKLFQERGYGRVTVADIAAAAGTAVPTVYASTGGKSAVLAQLCAAAERDPIVDETLVAVRDSRSPGDIVRVTGHGTRVDNERHHDLIEVLVDAARLDETARATLAASDDLYRRTLAESVRRMHELRPLPAGFTVARATDVLWFYFGHNSWRMLVGQCGWSWSSAEEWLVAQATNALVTPESL